MKQTAVEWLVDQIFNDVDLKDSILKLAIQQAKAMEKEHMIEAWDNGFANGYDLGKHDDQPNSDDAEEYYNETFKSE